jgi:hypothetical protein
MKARTDREMLLKVGQFLRYPPQLGKCAMINVDALNGLLNEISERLNEEYKGSENDQ